MNDGAAPELEIKTWLNTAEPLTLASLRGRVVFAVAFQMLCPSCVSEGLPQAQRARAMFPENDLVVIGLHTVFEHHEAQGTEAALKAFLHEYRIGFPVGIDMPNPDYPLPKTMQAYGMRGTPTTLLFDRRGRLRVHQFGHLEDMQLGAAIATLIESGKATLGEAAAPAAEGGRCTVDGACS